MKTIRKPILCTTCKNNFVSKVYRYYEEKRFNEIQLIDITSNCSVKKENVDLNELVITYENGNIFCVYTHERETAIECSFYDKKIKTTPLKTASYKRKMPDHDSDSGESTKFQDIDRTYLSSERQAANRWDCRNVA